MGAGDGVEEKVNQFSNNGGCLGVGRRDDGQMFLSLSFSKLTWQMLQCISAHAYLQTHKYTCTDMPV